MDVVDVAQLLPGSKFGSESMPIEDGDYLDLLGSESFDSDEEIHYKIINRKKHSYKARPGAPMRALPNQPAVVRGGPDNDDGGVCLGLDPDKLCDSTTTMTMVHETLKTTRPEKDGKVNRNQMSFSSSLLNLNNGKIQSEKKNVSNTESTSLEACARRINRAKRFGIVKKESEEGIVKEKPGEGIVKEEQSSTKETVFQIPKKGSKIDGNLVRPEALFIRGVDNMSTHDVFRYFGSYGPSSIEWLNDTSCNVVWLDPNTTARALMGMSQPMVNKGPIIEEITPRIDLKTHDNTATEPMEEGDDDFLDLISDSETGERVRIPRKPCQELVDRCNIENRSTEDADMEIEKVEEEKLFDLTEEQALYNALPFAKAEHLQIRYATKVDKKQVGAQNRSWYYIKNGNPNYNGMKGLISNSMKKRISEVKTISTTRTRKRRLEAYVEEKIMKKEKSSPHGDGDAENLEQEVKLLTRAPSPKRVMRMYADDVEQQVKNIRKLSTPVGLQVVIEPDHHHMTNRITGEVNNSGIIRRIGRHPCRGAIEGTKKVEHQNLFLDLRGKLNRKTNKRILSEISD